MHSDINEHADERGEIKATVCLDVVSADKQ